MNHEIDTAILEALAGLAAVGAGLSGRMASAIPLQLLAAVAQQTLAFQFASKYNIAAVLSIALTGLLGLHNSGFGDHRYLAFRWIVRPMAKAARCMQAAPLRARPVDRREWSQCVVL